MINQKRVVGHGHLVPASQGPRQISGRASRLLNEPVATKRSVLRSDQLPNRDQGAKREMKLNAVIAVFLLWPCFPAVAQQNGAALYSQYCAQCHESGNKDIRAPSRSLMQSKTFEDVLRTITTGSMASIAQGRTNDERMAIASFITAKASENLAAAPAGQCAQNATGFPRPPDGPRWNGWGADFNNSRFQPAALTPDQGPRLQLKWAFGFPGASAANAQPTIIGGLVFVGGSDRNYALDAKSGCTRWAFATEAAVRTAISFATIVGTDQSAVFFLMFAPMPTP
jgi:polyvinyl alcohol dehydrogenase (cytochrome)